MLSSEPVAIIVVSLCHPKLNSYPDFSLCFTLGSSESVEGTLPFPALYSVNSIVVDVLGST